MSLIDRALDELSASNRGAVARFFRSLTEGSAEVNAAGVQYVGAKVEADGAAADTTAATYFATVRGSRVYQTAYLVPSDALVANANDYAMIRLVKTRNGVSLTLATLSTAAGSWTAGEPVFVPPSTVVPASLALLDGDTIAWDIAKVGNGVEVPAFAVSVNTDPGA